MISPFFQKLEFSRVLQLHMFEKQVLMLNMFYLKKFIMKVSIKIRETHFSPLLLLDPLLIQVLNIIVDRVLSVFLL